MRSVASTIVTLATAISALVSVTAWTDLKGCGNGGCNCPVEGLCASGKSKNNCAWCCESGKNCGWENFLFRPPVNTCKNILVDNANCGACGHKCLDGSSCESGKCKVTPIGGYSARSTLPSNHLVTTSVTSNGILVLTIDFSTISATATPMLPNGTQIPTLDMPRLSGVTVDEFVIGAINTAAKFIATQIVDALKTGGGRRKLLDHPGCDFPGPPDTACSINCCAQHDKCYHDNHCTAASWINRASLVTLPEQYQPCDNCNSKVADCIYASYSLTCEKCVSITPAGQSCYDKECDLFFSCPEICPCYSTGDVPDGASCCSCQSPCKLTIDLGTPSPTPSETPSPTPSTTPPPTPSTTPSETPSATPSETPSATPSSTPSSTPSTTPSETPSTTPSSTPSETPSETPSTTPSSTPSETPSPTPSETPSPTLSPTTNSCPGLGPPTCCAGETGTQCGADCCCCPGCQAPGGPNCECLAAAC